MLTTNLKGGLGNQMFQYATGLYLAQTNKVGLFLDTNWFSKKSVMQSDTRRTFDLNYFNISAEILSLQKAHRMKYPFGLLSKIYVKIRRKLFKEYYLDYHPALLKKISKKIKSNESKNVYLDGFFQSEKNFAPIREQLLKEFTLKPQFQSEKFKEIALQTSQKNSVSIHIRRGDYIKNKKTNEYHGTCPIEYYNKAIKLISEKISQTQKSAPNPEFFIFSDDIEWSKQNLKINYPTNYISDNKLSGPEELILMSKCKHNIIANSSFSWWGAWLNQNPNKIVIAPQKWINNTPNPHLNIIPETWITI